MTLQNVYGSGVKKLTLRYYVLFLNKRVMQKILSEQQLNKSCSKS